MNHDGLDKISEYYIYLCRRKQTTHIL